MRWPGQVQCTSPWSTRSARWSCFAPFQKEHTMKKKIAKSTHERQMTRRQMVGSVLAAAGVITGAPNLLRARNVNDKLNIAMIACGGRGLANMNGDGAIGIPAENITVLCDVNQNA